MVTTSSPSRCRPVRLTAGLLVLALALTLQVSTRPETAAATPQPPAAALVGADIEDLAAYVPASSTRAARMSSSTRFLDRST